MSKEIATTRSRAKFIKGFTLVEMSLVLILIGFAVAAGTISFAHFSNDQKARLTAERMDKVLNAVAVYAQRYYRVPCAADPAATGANMGAEIGAGRCFNRDNTIDNNFEAMGIVPWRVLGLTETDVTDGWGRYFTYKPALHLTLDNTSANMMTASDETTNDVHDACRTLNWFNSEGKHINRAKALFCCNAEPKPEYLTKLGADNAAPTNTAGWNETVSPATQYMSTLTDVRQAAWIVTSVATSNKWIESASSGLIGDFAIPVTETMGHDQSSISRASGIAVSLISHGPNGKLSFTKGAAKTARNMGTFDASTGALTANNAGAADLEILNALPASSGTTINPKTAMNNGIAGGGSLLDDTGQRDNASDDMAVVIRTDQLLAKVGGASCLNLANLETPKIAPVNGACGTAHLTSVAVIPSSNPSSNLCATGAPSAVNGTGPWQWECSEANGGVPQKCMAFHSASAPGGACPAGAMGPLEILADFTGTAAVVPTAATCLTASYTARMAPDCTAPVGACLHQILFNGDTTRCEVYGRSCQ